MTLRENSHLQSTALPTELSQDNWCYTLDEDRTHVLGLGLLDPRSNQLSYKGLMLWKKTFPSQKISPGAAVVPRPGHQQVTCLRPGPQVISSRDLILKSHMRPSSSQTKSTGGENVGSSGGVSPSESDSRYLTPCCIGADT